MARQQQSPQQQFTIAYQRILLMGEWTALGLHTDTFAALAQPFPDDLCKIDGSGLTALDAAGARTILDLRQRLQQSAKTPVTLIGFAANQEHLLALVAEHEFLLPNPPPRLGLVAQIGRATQETGADLLAYLAFVGNTTGQFLRWLARPRSIRLRAILAETQLAGVNALFIVGLLSFLMGIVIAYQGGGPLDEYGANIFIVDLVGLTILREIAPLVTAIIVAGRTGSAYTAQIGAMRITEEVDALRSLAIDPIEILVLPKLLAMLVVLPLLITFADFAGLAGGILVSDVMFGVGLQNYIERLPQTFYMPSSFWVGLIKAPVFALIITSIGCHQGFRVSGGASSVGYATTRSVVQSIFLVIVVDAVFSVVFNRLDL